MTPMDLPIQSIKSLRDAGRDAAKRGEPGLINPFPPGCLHHKLWAAGHDWAVIAMKALDGSALEALSVGRRGVQ